MAKASDFIEDGHKVHFRWNKDTVEISRVDCPHERVSKCNRLRDNCVVSTFLSVYGTELCVGSTAISGPVQIAWYPIPGECDIDREFKHVWVVPIDDTDYLGAKFLEAEESEPPELESGDS